MFKVHTVRLYCGPALATRQARIAIICHIQNNMLVRHSILALRLPQSAIRTPEEATACDSATLTSVFPTPVFGAHIPNVGTIKDNFEAMTQLPLDHIAGQASSKYVHTSDMCLVAKIWNRINLLAG